MQKIIYWKYIVYSNWFIASARKILKNSKDKNWYSVVSLYIDWKHKIWKVHRIIAQTFIPNPYNKPQVNHINWNKSDNTMENLERVTISENCIHKYRQLWYSSNNKWRYWKDTKNGKTVIQKDLNWNIVHIWDSIMDIKRKFWFDQWTISNFCNWKKNMKTLYWYLRSWKRKEK